MEEIEPQTGGKESKYPSEYKPDVLTETVPDYYKDYTYGQTIRKLKPGIEVEESTTTSTKKYCLAKLSSSQSFLSGTESSLSVNTFTTNDAGMSVTNGRIIITEAGVYVITSQIRWASNTSGLRHSTLYANNSIIYGTNVKTPVSGNDSYVQCQSVGYFNIGDYIQLLGFQDSGISLSASSGTGSFLNVAQL